MQTPSVKWLKWLSNLLPTTFLNYTARNGENGIPFSRRCLIVSHSSQNTNISDLVPVHLALSVCTSCSPEKKTIKIFKKKVTAVTVKRARLSPVISPGSITEERKKYLYEQIRPFVFPQYQDVTCPPL